MATLANVNGRIGPVEEAVVPVWDRGFIFGDAVYEVWRLYGGRLWLEAEHCERLRRSLGELRIGGVDMERLMGRVRGTIAASGEREATVYVQVTRGTAPRSHVFPDPAVSPTEVIIVRAYEDEETARRRMSGVAVVSRPDIRWGRCDIKSTNLLANVLALQEAKERGGFEAVLQDRDGFVTEATHSSLMWVRDGRLEGTPEGKELLPGTTRALVRTLAEGAGIPFGERRVTLEEFSRSDEVILSGTTIEIMPVVKVDDRAIGGGKAGPLTARLQGAFRGAVEEFLAGA